MSPGEMIATAWGDVRLVRKIDGESSFFGWEVVFPNGKKGFLDDSDFGLTREQLDDIRAALRRA